MNWISGAHRFAIVSLTLPYLQSQGRLMQCATSNSPLLTTKSSLAAAPVSPSLIKISPAMTLRSYISCGGRQVKLSEEVCPGNAAADVLQRQCIQRVSFAGAGGGKQARARGAGSRYCRTCLYDLSLRAFVQLVEEQHVCQALLQQEHRTDLRKSCVWYPLACWKSS